MSEMSGENLVAEVFSSGSAASDLMAIVQSAAQIADGSQRDAALLAALRICRHELEAAEAESAATRLCLSDAKDTFDCASKMLSGAPPPSLRESADSSSTVDAGGSSAKNGKRGVGGLSSENDRNRKRSKTTASSIPTESERHIDSATPLDVPIPVLLPTNPIRLPAFHASVETGVLTGDAIMSAEAVANHRENFYEKLLGTSFAEVDDYAPNLNQANLRSKRQLAEGIHIVRHWDTGADGLDAAAFRTKHKNWYTKMKPVSLNLGRRTGIHLRTVEPQHGQREAGEGETTVLCRYNKDGTKSTVYLDVSQLYDALIEVHCLEHGHLRGREAVKTRLDELYANVPDSQLKIFLDTCPVSMERQGGQEDLIKVQGV